MLRFHRPGLCLVTALAACGGPPAATPGPRAAAPSDPRGACTPENARKEEPAGKVRLVVATGGTGGVFYPFGGGLARVLTARAKDVEATAEVTGGSVDNMKLVQAEEADIGFSTMDSAWDALRGAGSYTDTGPIPACAIAVLYQSYVHVVAAASSGARGIADLRGKRVSVGSAGSSTEAAADRILEAAGLDPRRDIRRDNLSVSESAGALRDEKVDAFFWIGGLPTAAVTDLATTSRHPIAFLEAGSLVDAMRARGGPVYEPMTLPKGTYLGQDRDVPGVGVGNVLFVNARMSEGLVGRVLAAVFDNLPEVQRIHPEAAGLSLETAARGGSVPFHPGAVRFYQERGAWPK
ncbi:MAG TPA: TAXI family TRAP transporter solute-binding subunit [Vicinamibacteria bacterium]|nr:TAXI family TRAP transporter solute-binding subunit [Vicinamibacteria bacterium]